MITHVKMEESFIKVMSIGDIIWTGSQKDPQFPASLYSCAAIMMVNTYTKKVGFYHYPGSGLISDKEQTRLTTERCITDLYQNVSPNSICIFQGKEGPAQVLRSDRMAIIARLQQLCTFEPVEDLNIFVNKQKQIVAKNNTNKIVHAQVSSARAIIKYSDDDEIDIFYTSTLLDEMLE